jgi:hypothetical protein
MQMQRLITLYNNRSHTFDFVRIGTYANKTIIFVDQIINEINLWEP